MGVVRQFSEKLNNSKKIQVAFFAVSLAILFSIYLPSMHLIRTVREEEKFTKQEISNDFRVLPYVSNMEIVDNHIFLNGWMIRQNSIVSEVNILFSSKENADIKIARTKCFAEDMSNTSYPKAVDYGKNGFAASLKSDELEENICYEMYYVLNYIENGDEISKKIFSGKYFFNGDLYNYNPLIYVSPQIADETLNEVITTENVRYYNANLGVWVFEKNDRLFFVVDERFEIKNDGTHRMKFHVHTMHPELLALPRQKYGYDSKDFFFVEKEMLLQENCGYRVAVLDLPTEYEISWIELGLYEVGGAMLKDMSFLFFDGTK